MPDEISELSISQLARDVAQGLIPLQKILENARMTPAQFDKIVEHPFFKSRLEEEANRWSGDVRARVQAKAATLIEESLDEVYMLVHDRAQPLNHKIDALKFAARLAAMEDGGKNVTDTDKVTININIGEDRRITFEKDVTPMVIEGTAEVTS